MSKDIKGGGMAGGGADSDPRAVNTDLLEFIGKQGKNGIVLDGVVTWIEIQQDRSADELWKAQAIAGYTDEEIYDAKVALWNAAGPNIGADILR